MKVLKKSLSQKMSPELTGLIWEIVSNQIVYTHKTPASPLRGFILGFIMCDDAKEYSCMNYSQKCGLQYSRALLEILFLLRLEARSYPTVTGWSGRREESCNNPSQREGEETLLYQILSLSLPFPSDQITQSLMSRLEMTWHSFSLKDMPQIQSEFTKQATCHSKI